MTIVIICLGGAVYYISGSSLQRIQQEQNGYIATTWADKIADLIASRQRQFSEIAKSQVVEEYSHVHTIGSLNQYFSSFAEIFPYISYVNEKGGEEAKIVNGKVSKDLILQTGIVERARQTPNVPVTKLVVSQAETAANNFGQEAPYLQLVIYNEIFGEFAGVIMARVPLQQSTTELAQIKTFHFGESGFISLYDMQGRTIFHHNPDNILKKINLPENLDDVVYMEDTQLSFRRDTVHSIDGYTSYVRVLGSDIVVAATTPYDQFQQTPNQLKKLFVALSIAIALVCFLLSAFIAKGISQPLLSLTSVAGRLAKGEWGHKLEISSGDEVGRLGESFQQMSDNLHKMIISRDNEIDLRRKVEQAIKVSHLELDQIFNTTAGGMLVIDLSHEIIRVNDTFLLMFGYKRQEVIGQKCHDLFTQSDCGTEQCHLSMAIKANEKIEHEVDEVKKDGTPIICSLAVAPFYGANGDLVGVIEDFRDITITKKTEELVKMSEERYRLLFNSAPDGISVLNDQGVIIDCNSSAALIYNRPRIEIIGRHFTYFNTPESAKSCRQNF